MAEVILALDVADGEEAARLLDRLPRLRWVKVGSVLMTREGPGLLRRLADRGLRIFLDLKWHDIPNTVAGAARAAAAQHVSLATLHIAGGEDMIRSAVAAAGPDLALVGVTVLTSHDDRTYAQATGRDQVNLAEEVLRLARLGTEAGLRGVVCSPAETAPVREALGPAAWIVVPGIRRAGDAAGDQARTGTPAGAAAAGATHLVVGRPILQAPDPAAALADFMAAAG